MRESGFTESRWESNSVGDLLRSLPPREMYTATVAETVADACARMKRHGVSQLPVVDNGQLVGMISETDVLSRIIAGHTSMKDVVAEAMIREVRTVHLEDDATVLTRLFAEGGLGVVVDDSGALQGIISKMGLVDFLTTSVEPASVG